MKKKIWTLLFSLLILSTFAFLVFSCGQAISANWESGATSSEFIAVDTTVEQVKNEVREFQYKEMTLEEAYERYPDQLPEPERFLSAPDTTGYLSAAEAASIMGEAIFNVYGEDLSNETLDVVLVVPKQPEDIGISAFWMVLYCNYPEDYLLETMPRNFKKYDFTLDAVTGMPQYGRRAAWGKPTETAALSRANMDADLTEEEATALKEKTLKAAEALGLGKPMKYFGEADFSMSRAYIDQSFLLMENGDLVRMRFDYQFPGGALADFWVVDPALFGGKEFLETSFVDLP